jgi:Lon protease-like protein
MLPPVIPIFPLPSTVLFPNVFLPLHIFEPRYRQMVADAVESDRIIGMALLRPGWEQDYEGRPPVYPIGCAGLITHVERLDDGRYNIVLHGLEKFRLVSETGDRAYRQARIETILDECAASDRESLREARHRLESLIVPSSDPGVAERRVPASMPDVDLVNALAQYLELEPLERQALLEREGPLRRCHSLIELLEMKVMLARHQWAAGGQH